MKVWKGKVHKVLSGLYFSYLGSRPHWTDFHKNWQSCRVNDVIIYSNCAFNILGVSDLQGIEISIFPLNLPMRGMWH